MTAPPHTVARSCRTVLALLVALGTLGRADPKLPPDVPLKNPGFEAGHQGWSEELFQRFQALVTVERKVGHTGTSSLKMTSPQGVESPYLTQTVEGIQGGATYLLRVWVKGDPEVKPVLPGLKIEFYNPAGVKTSESYARGAAPGVWQPLEVRARADADTVRATVLLRLFGRGTVWFDDVELLMVAPPPALALEPAHQIAQAGKDRAVPFLLRLAEEWKAADLPPFALTVLAPPKGEAIQAPVEFKRDDARTFEGLLKLPNAVSGAYRLECRLPGKDVVAAGWLFVPLVNRRPKYLTDDGTLLAGGKPFFPIGLYHVGPGSYADVARRGFNCVQGMSNTDLGAFGDSLRPAEMAGLMVEGPLYAEGKVWANLPLSLKKLGRFRKHAMILGWTLADEPDARPEVAEEVPQAYQALHLTDPDHPLSLTLGKPDQFGYWANFCDVVQVAVYPIPGQPLTLISDTLTRARKALQPWQNLTVVLQAGWVKDPMNQPTFAQARVMVYLALISGARGIFWYAFNDPGWRLSETPLWPRFDEINKETAALAKPLLGGTEPKSLKVEADGEGLHWLARDLAAKTYVLLANLGPRTLKVTVTPGDPSLAASLMSGNPTQMKEGKATVDLAPESAETLILAAPAPPTPVKPEKPPAAKPQEKPTLPAK